MPGGNAYVMPVRCTRHDNGRRERNDRNAYGTAAGAILAADIAGYSALMGADGAHGA